MLNISVGRAGRDACAQRALAIGIAAIAIALLVPAALAATPKTRLEFKQGPREITEAERATAADPARGIDGAYVYVDLNEWTHKTPFEARSSRRVRAKVLSEEGLAVADIVVPYAGNDINVIWFWAFAVLPDGTVREVQREELVYEPILERQQDKVGRLRGRIPDVVPGSIVEIGYDVEMRRFTRPPRTTLRGPWFIERFAYRWVPFPELYPEYFSRGAEIYLGSFAARIADRPLGRDPDSKAGRPMMPAFYVGRGEGVETKVERDMDAVLVEASNLPPFAARPLEPARESLTGVVAFFYSFEDSRSVEDFWIAETRGEVREIERFTKKTKRLSNLIVEMGIKNPSSLEEKLARIHGWLQANVTIVGEDAELTETPFYVGIHQRGGDRSANDVIEDKRGTAEEVRLTFLALAKLVGASCEVIRVTDRRERYWEPAYRSFEQFDATLTIVRGRGRDTSASPLIIDAASRLPFGIVPWYYTGAPGALLTEQGPVEFRVPVESAAVNLRRSEVRLVPALVDASIFAEWSVTFGGQHLMRVDRIASQEGAEREAKVRELCSQGRPLDITKAALAPIDAATGTATLTCSAKLPWEVDAAKPSSLRVPVAGPWIASLPEFGARTRSTPLVLEYPSGWVDEIVVVPPPGFAVSTMPKPARMQTDAAGYELRVEAVQEGAKVQRTLALTSLLVPADRLAQVFGVVDRARVHDLGEVVLAPN